MKKTYFLIFACVVLLAIAAGCRSQDFEGTRTADENQFTLDYSFLDKTETHTMNLEQGTGVKVKIESLSGRIDVVVSDAYGKELYRGNDASSGSFLLEIPETGAYTFSVTGSRADGSVAFAVEE